MIDKYNIECSKFNLKEKPVFLFVNHKVALMCWAQIKESLGQKTNVITFDSHRDFYGGLIVGKNMLEPYFRSNYIKNKQLEHFTRCEEFLTWDLLDGEQNKKFITEQKRFLTINNDNFIDVAFMKDIVSNVYWHYIEAPFGGKSDKCDDFKGKDHLLVKSSIKRINQLKKAFILDIDIDFFAGEIDFKKNPFSDEVIKKYLELQEKLFSSELCVGMTIALEPFFCGGENNCLYLCKKLGDKFGVDLVVEARKLIENSIS